jgi:protein associated with RNAse G/E
MASVRVVYRKYDGALHWNYAARHLGEDEHGVWVGAPAGTPVSLGDQARGPVEAPHVLLFPREGWWTGCFNATPHRTEIYCDITTVPVWSGTDEVTMIDLDLDVRRLRTGVVELLDEDEFAEHQVRYGYPAEVIAGARQSADRLFDAVERRVEPFGDAYRTWLNRVDGRMTNK